MDKHRIALHPSSRSPEGIERLAGRIPPARLTQDRTILCDLTADRLDVLRSECTVLADLMRDKEPETVAIFTESLEAFCQSFTTLVTSITKPTQPVYLD